MNKHRYIIQPNAKEGFVSVNALGDFTKRNLSVCMGTSGVMAFRHSSLKDLAKKYGSTCKNFTPDSCDMIFPSKEAFDEFEKERNSLNRE